MRRDLRSKRSQPPRQTSSTASDPPCVTSSGTWWSPVCVTSSTTSWSPFPIGEGFGWVSCGLTSAAAPPSQALRRQLSQRESDRTELLKPNAPPVGRDLPSGEFTEGESVSEATVIVSAAD